MKLNTAIALVALLSLSACQKDSGPVPEDWYLLPENGQAQNPGSLDQLGKIFDQFLSIHSSALEQVQTPSIGSDDGSGKPVDWVPWHLAIFSSDFAITTDGMFGALSSEGSASVQATWEKHGTFGALTHSVMSPKLHRAIVPQDHKSDLLIRGMARADQVTKSIEPRIQAAIDSGQVHNPEAFRKQVLTAAQSFRAMAARLSAIQVDGGEAMKPSAFRLEISVDADGNISPLVSVGGGIDLRFDWVIGDTSEDPDALKTALLQSPQAAHAADSMESFVRGILPDLNEAMTSASDIKASGFELASVRIGLILTADFDVAVAQTSSEAIASIVFGDNDEEGGCYDPDGDGDCHNHETLKAASDRSASWQDDGGVPVFVSKKSPAKLLYAQTNSQTFKPALALMDETSSDGQIYRISHDKLQEGLKRAIWMSGFFTSHASSLGSSWRISELETEFDLSLSGTLGIATVGAGGELELEFEYKGK